jgi:hypothetical protein
MKKVCHVCGREYTLDDNAVATHDSDESPDGIDHAADADHVPFGDEE